MQGNYITILEADLSFGSSGEERALPLLREEFGEDLVKNQKKYARFDFHNKKKTIFIELKTRRCAKNRFDTTVVPLGKVNYAEGKIVKALASKKTPPTFYYCFQFTDGLYYVEHTKLQASKPEIKDLKRYDSTRGVPHVYIDTQILEPLIGKCSDISEELDLSGLKI